MGNFYSDGKFGVIHRKWFGLTKKCGGDSAGGFTLTAEAGTKATHVTRWYPKGPIKVLKAGHLVLATIACTATTMDRLPFFIRKNTTRMGAGWFLADNSAQYSIGSQTSWVNAAGVTLSTLDAGDYISIEAGTPETDKATDVTTATVTGTVSFFIDYAPTFSSTGKWDT